MTVLENSIHVSAPPEKVWSALASLDALAKYDPGIKKVEIVSTSWDGLGSAREHHAVMARVECPQRQAGWISYMHPRQGSTPAVLWGTCQSGPAACHLVGDPGSPA